MASVKRVSSYFNYSKRESANPEKATHNPEKANMSRVKSQDATGLPRVRSNEEKPYFDNPKNSETSSLPAVKSFNSR